MIFIEDYRKLPAGIGNRQELDMSELIGQTVTVRTAAGAVHGVVVLDTCDTLTLAYTRVSRRRRENRRIIVLKRHIIAIDARLR